MGQQRKRCVACGDVCSAPWCGSCSSCAISAPFDIWETCTHKVDSRGACPKEIFQNPGMKISLKVFTLIPKAKYRPLNYQIWHNRVAGGVLCFAQVILFLFSLCIPSHIFHLIWCDFATPQIIFSANLFLRTHHVRHYPTNILVYFCNLHVSSSSFFLSLYLRLRCVGFLFSTVV